MHCDPIRPGLRNDMDIEHCLSDRSSKNLLPKPVHHGLWRLARGHRFLVDDVGGSWRAQRSKRAVDVRHFDVDTFHVFFTRNYSDFKNKSIFCQFEKAEFCQKMVKLFSANLNELYNRILCEQVSR